MEYLYSLFIFLEFRTEAGSLGSLSIMVQERIVFFRKEGKKLKHSCLCKDISVRPEEIRS